METLQTHCYATEPSRYYRNAIKASQYKLTWIYKQENKILVPEFQLGKT
jgi:hypothetical protein